MKFESDSLSARRRKVIAYYQWDTSLTFSDIDKAVPIADICRMYNPYGDAIFYPELLFQKNYDFCLIFVCPKATPHNTTPTKENILGAEQGQGCALKVFARTN